MILKYLVKENNLTINYILKNELKISSRLQLKLIKNNLIFLNDNISDTRNITKPGDIIYINLDYEEENSNIIPTKIDLNIIYEDEWLLIVDKPSGIPVHPSMDHYEDSLSNGIKFYFDSIGLKKKIRPVNRLDKDTSRFSCICKK